MKAHPRPDADLLEWAASIIARQQREKTYATVSVFIEGGRIIRAKVETNEKPPVDRDAR